MKISDLLQLNAVYQKIDAGTTEIPFKTAYKFVQLKEAIEKPITFYQEQMNKLIEEYAQKDDNGHYKMTEDRRDVLIVEGKEQECHEKVMELEACDFTIPDITFSLDELANLSLSLSEMTALMSFIYI